MSTQARCAARHRRSVPRTVLLAVAAAAILSSTACSALPPASPASVPDGPTGTATVPPGTPAAPVPGGSSGGVAPPAGAPAGPGSCHAADGGFLPDPACTPGEADARVTQDTIDSTICRRGYTATVRPPASVTEPIKRERMAAYGDAGPLSAYELDHLIPLELGGASTVANLWPEPRADPRGAARKDELENALKRDVCAGSLSLAGAQSAIASQWESAYTTYVGTLPG